MTAAQYALCIFVALMLAGGQFLFKLAAQHWNANASEANLISGLFSVPLIAALGVYGVATLLWIYALRQVPLSVAYLFVLAGAAIVPIVANLYFHEPLSLRFWIGFALILMGLYVASAA